jgi:serine protease Do
MAEQFVSVRMVQMNGIDLERFQFDYDLTLAALFMNADDTVYGRYGKRSSQTSAGDVSTSGFAKAMARAIELHHGYPDNKASLQGKQGKKPRFKLPEEYPSLQKAFKSEAVLTGQLSKRCLHCHQVREAERLVFRSARKPVPDNVLYPFPLANALGIELDPDEIAQVVSVTRGSAADRAGLRSGDSIVSLGGQPLLSIADIQWVLHHAGDSASIGAEVRRDAEIIAVSLQLEDGWRRSGDLSFRTSTWDLRRMGSGGLVLEEISEDDRRKHGLPPSALALRVKYVGEYDDHAAAKRAGFQKDDIIVEVDGRKDRMTETSFLAYAVQSKSIGQKVEIGLLRNGKRLDLSMPMQ